MEPANQAVLGTDHAIPEYVSVAFVNIANCVVTVVWGICALCQCAAHNFGSLLAVRIILGYAPSL